MSRTAKRSARQLASSAGGPRPALALLRLLFTAKQAPRLVSGGAISDATPADWKDTLLLHNIYRCLHNSPPLVWNTDLAANSQAYIDTGACAAQLCGGHSANSARTTKMGFTGVFGENIAWGTVLGQKANWGKGTKWWYEDEIILTEGGWPGTLPANSVALASSAVTTPGVTTPIAAWTNEAAANGKGLQSKHTSAVGHYTQVVWGDSWELGCAGIESGKNVVCQYGKSGNVNSASYYTANVHAISKTYAQCASANDDQYQVQGSLVVKAAGGLGSCTSGQSFIQSGQADPLKNALVDSFKLTATANDVYVEKNPAPLYAATCTQFTDGSIDFEYGFVLRSLTKEKAKCIKNKLAANANYVLTALLAKCALDTSNTAGPCAKTMGGNPTAVSLGTAISMVYKPAIADDTTIAATTGDDCSGEASTSSGSSGGATTTGSTSSTATTTAAVPQFSGAMKLTFTSTSACTSALLKDTLGPMVATGIATTLGVAASGVTINSATCLVTRRRRLVEEQVDVDVEGDEFELDNKGKSEPRKLKFSSLSEEMAETGGIDIASLVARMGLQGWKDIGAESPGPRPRLLSQEINGDYAYTVTGFADQAAADAASTTMTNILSGADLTAATTLTTSIATALLAGGNTSVQLQAVAPSPSASSGGSSSDDDGLSGGVIALIIILVLVAVGGGGGAAWYFIAGPGRSSKSSVMKRAEGETPATSVEMSNPANPQPVAGAAAAPGDVKLDIDGTAAAGAGSSQTATEGAAAAGQEDAAAEDKDLEAAATKIQSLQRAKQAKKEVDERKSLQSSKSKPVAKIGKKATASTASLTK
eukprot:g17713.t1